MKEESIEPKSRVVLVATVLWLLAWLLAVAYGQGFEIQRRVVAIPGVVLAGLLVLPDLLRRQVLWLPGAVVVVLGGLYFSWRALSSPVWDLAREDLLLVSLGLLSVVVGARVMASVRALKVFLGGLVLVFLANAGVALVQEASDPGYAFMRSPRVDQHGVSGLLWHRNYFAGLLELMVPVFLGVTLVSRSRWIRGAFGILVVVGLALGFFSHSRGGLLAIGIGCAAGLFLWLQRGWKSKTWNARLGLTLGGLMVSALVLVGTLALASRVSEQRGASGNLEEALMHSGYRLILTDYAYNQ